MQGAPWESEEGGKFSSEPEYEGVVGQRRAEQASGWGKGRAVGGRQKSALAIRGSGAYYRRVGGWTESGR